MSRQILHAHTGGRETALSNPQAVVVDYDLRCLHQGSDRYRNIPPRLFAFMAFMLRSADLRQEPAAIRQAVYDRPDGPRSALATMKADAKPILAWLRMTFETNYSSGLTLHSDPRSTLPCETLALSPSLPTHVRSHRKGRVVRPVELSLSHEALRRQGRVRSRQQKGSRPKPSPNSTPSNSPGT